MLGLMHPVRPYRRLGGTGRVAGVTNPSVRDAVEQHAAQIAAGRPPVELSQSAAPGVAKKVTYGVTGLPRRLF